MYIFALAIGIIIYLIVVVHLVIFYIEGIVYLNILFKTRLLSRAKNSYLLIVILKFLLNNLIKKSFYVVTKETGF